MTEPIAREYRVARCDKCGELEILRILDRNGGVCASCMTAARKDAEGIAHILSKTCGPDVKISQHDPVHRPSHYRRGGYELIDVMEAWGLDSDGYIMQAVQYLFRAGLKGSSKLEDYEKARYYLDRRITRMKNEAKESDKGRRPG